MENNKIVTRNELNPDRRLTKIETNDKWFRWFLSVAIVVGATTLIGIYSLLFSLQEDVATLTADVEILDSRMEKFETRMEKFETRMDIFEIRLGYIEYYLKLNSGVPPTS